MIENKKTIVSFIDRVAPKNKLQIDIMHDLGYSPVFFANTYTASADQYFQKTGKQIILAPGFFSRFRQVFSFLKNNRHSIHHAEVYPGGRFSFLYLLLAKFFRIKTICAERGDLTYFKKGGYDPVTRFSMWVCYKQASIVWYRELFMEEILKKMHVKKLFFLHNAVDDKGAKNGSGESTSYHSKQIDFLWVNRLTPQRRSDWFVDILAQEGFEDTHNVLAGILPQTLYQAEQEYVLAHKPANLELIEFVADPSELYKKAKFFVLPATAIFANNALLEAMSSGVVPIIVNRSGSSLIVQHEVSGLISAFDKTAFQEAMLRAVHMKEEEYHIMSAAAKKQIQQNFSSEMYHNKLKELYSLIED